MTLEKFRELFFIECENELDMIATETEEGTIEIDFCYLADIAYDLLIGDDDNGQKSN